MEYSNEPLLDRVILNENTMNSVALQEELFTLFFDQGELYISELEAALREGDVAAWRMTAHGVKGASRSLGMTRLATIAMEAERSPPNADRFDRMRSIMAETRASVWPKHNAA